GRTDRLGGSAARLGACTPGPWGTARLAALRLGAEPLRPDVDAPARGPAGGWDLARGRMWLGRDLVPARPPGVGVRPGIGTHVPPRPARGRGAVRAPPTLLGPSGGGVLRAAPPRGPGRPPHHQPLSVGVLSPHGCSVLAQICSARRGSSWINWIPLFRGGHTLGRS